MFKSYLKTALRHLWRHKLYAAINIGGLAVALASAFLLLDYVREEMNWDGFHPDAERIYEVYTEIHNFGAKPIQFLRAPSFIYEFLGSELPELEQAVRRDMRQFSVKVGGDRFFDSFGEIDPEFLNMIRTEFIEGDRETALADVSSLVLTRAGKTKYFGDGPALGKTLILDDRDYRITGVIENLPPNTDFSEIGFYRLDMSQYPDANSRVFGKFMSLYLKLPVNLSPDTVQVGIRKIGKTYSPEQQGDRRDITYSLIELAGPRFFVNENRGDTMQQRLFALAAVAIAITLVAMINYLNLTSAINASRNKEVALRKVQGARPSNIAFQFGGNAIFISVIAGLAAVGLIWLAQPWFETYVALREMSASITPANILLLLSVSAVVGLISGLRPALVIARLKPISVLSGNGGAGALQRNIDGKSILVAGQFIASITLIAFTQVIQSQISYSESVNNDLINQNIVYFRLPGNEPDQLVAPMSAALKIHPDLQNVMSANTIPGSGFLYITSLNLPGRPLDEAVRANSYTLSDGSFESLGIPLLTGRFLDPARGDDVFVLPETDGSSEQVVENELRSLNILVNEATVLKMGISAPKAAIGLSLFNGTNLGDNPAREYRIVGVLANVHERGARSEMTPSFFSLAEQAGPTVSAIYTGNDETSLRKYIEEAWQTQNQAAPLQVNLLRDLGHQYSAVERAHGQTMLAAAAIAIIIGALGILGLASQSAQQSAREMSLRKVMGAAPGDILRLVLWRFSLPVLGGIIIALPVAWLVASNWLNGFAYRIELSVQPFAVAALGALAIALLTVAHHAIRAARTHPAEVLRYE